MRGPKPSYPIELTSAEAKQLEQLIRAHTTSQSLALRARIILRAYEHPEQSNQQLASTLSTTDRTVRKWRGRWVKTHEQASARSRPRPCAGRVPGDCRYLLLVRLPTGGYYPAPLARDQHQRFLFPWPLRSSVQSVADPSGTRSVECES